VTSGAPSDKSGGRGTQALSSGNREASSTGEHAFEGIGMMRRAFRRLRHGIQVQRTNNDQGQQSRFAPPGRPFHRHGARASHRSLTAPPSLTVSLIDPAHVATLRTHPRGPEMFGDIARFLLNTLFTLFGAALLLRAWMQVVRMPPYNPVSNAVMQATNWIVLPLRKILPGGKIDWASILAAFIAAIVYEVLMALVSGIDPTIMMPAIGISAVLDVVKWMLNLIIWVTILMALLSWLNPQSPAMPLLYQITAPLLDPLRRILPRLGGIDLSPILLFVIVQVLLMVVTRVEYSLRFIGI
jgi:YggT family protein